MWTKMDYQKLIRAEIQKERKIKGQKDDKEDSKDIQTTSKELRWSSKIEWRRKWGGGWHQDRLIFWNLFHVFEKRCYLSLRCNRWSCFPLKKRQEVRKHMNQESQGRTFWDSLKHHLWTGSLFGRKTPEKAPYKGPNLQYKFLSDPSPIIGNACH